jgi:hypothetical protein
VSDPWEDEGFGAEDDWQGKESLESDLEDEDEDEDELQLADLEDEDSEPDELDTAL